MIGWPSLGCWSWWKEGGGFEINFRGGRARPCIGLMPPYPAPPKPFLYLHRWEQSPWPLGPRVITPSPRSQFCPLCINLLCASLVPVQSCHTVLSFVLSPLPPHCGVTTDHNCQGCHPQPTPQCPPSLHPLTCFPVTTQKFSTLTCFPTTTQTILCPLTCSPFPSPSALCLQPSSCP